MNRQPVRSSESDLVHELLIKQATGTMSPEFRKKYGSSELMFIAGSGVELLVDVLSATNILHSGVIALAKQSAVAKLALQNSPNLNGQVRKTLERDVEKGEELGPQAKAIIDDDFGPLNAVTLVSLCAALEVSLEDTIRAALRFKPGAIAHLRELGVKKLNFPEDRDLTYDEACAALRYLRLWAKSDMNAPEGTLRMLEAVGIDAAIDGEAKTALREMIYLRNCILHRGHRADEKSVEEAASLRLESGLRFGVSRASMGKYCNAALALVSGVALQLAATVGRSTS